MASVITRRGLTVLLSGLAVATANLATPAQAVAAESDQMCTTTTTGSTNWNVKESFNNYLEGPFANGMSKYPGGVEVRDGLVTAGEKSGRTFDWPIAEANLEAGTITHEGGVHYTGHNHYTGDDASQAPENFILDNDFSELTVEITGEASGRILVDYTSREFVDTTTVGDYKNGTQVELAEITFEAPVDLEAEGNVTFTGSTSLTASGVGVFGGQYGVGTELSDITLNLTNTVSCVDAPPANSDQDASSGSSDGAFGILAIIAALGGIAAAGAGWLANAGLLKF